MNCPWAYYYSYSICSAMHIQTQKKRLKLVQTALVAWILATSLPDTPPADTPLGSASSSYLADPPPSKRFSSVYISRTLKTLNGFTPTTLTEAPTGHWVTSETGPKRKTSTLPKKPWLFHLEKQSAKHGENNVCNSTALGITRNKTNHSLRAILVLWNVQERTGHRSLEALRVYERSSAEQHKAASTIPSTKQTLFPAADGPEQFQCFHETQCNSTSIFFSQSTELHHQHHKIELL